MYVAGPGTEVVLIVTPPRELLGQKSILNRRVPKTYQA